MAYWGSYLCFCISSCFSLQRVITFPIFQFVGGQETSVEEEEEEEVEEEEEEEVEEEEVEVEVGVSNYFLIW